MLKSRQVPLKNELISESQINCSDVFENLWLAFPSTNIFFPFPFANTQRKVFPRSFSDQTPFVMALKRIAVILDTINQSKLTNKAISSEILIQFRHEKSHPFKPSQFS